MCQSTTICWLYATGSFCPAAVTQGLGAVGEITRIQSFHLATWPKGALYLPLANKQQGQLSTWPGKHKRSVVEVPAAAAQTGSDHAHQQVRIRQRTSFTKALCMLCTWRDEVLRPPAVQTMYPTAVQGPGQLQLPLAHTSGQHTLQIDFASTVRLPSSSSTRRLQAQPDAAAAAEWSR